MIKYAELLKNPEIIAAIDQYKWIESEKNGYDIGFERASNEWFSKNAETWTKEKQAKKTCDKTIKKPVVKAVKKTTTKAKKTTRR